MSDDSNPINQTDDVTIHSAEEERDPLLPRNYKQLQAELQNSISLGKKLSLWLLALVLVGFLIFSQVSGSDVLDRLSIFPLVTPFSLLFTDFGDSPPIGLIEWLVYTLGCFYYLLLTVWGLYTKSRRLFAFLYVMFCLSLLVGFVSGMPLLPYD